MVLDAPHGEKSIKLVVYFYTTDLDLKKQCWDEGNVYVMANKAHGIRSDNVGRSEEFNGFEGILPAIKYALRNADITVFDYIEGKKRRHVAVDLKKE